MKPSLSPALMRALIALAVLACGLPGCRKHRPPERVSIEQLKVVLAPELASNQLSGLRGPIHEAYAGSPIHWQPMRPEVFQRSDESKRLIFCVIARPASAACHALLRELESDQEVVDAINTSYIPVLVDADVASEFALMGVELSDEIQRALAFPVLVWLNPAQHVLASTPVSSGQAGGIKQVFIQSDAMISPIWKDDLEKWQADGSPGYILLNSAHDHKRRLERMETRRAELRMISQPREDVPLAVHRLTCQYDGYVQNFGTAGAVVPAEAMILLARASRAEGLAESIRADARKVLADLSSHLMSSPMVDPLDGGVFSYRAGQSWKLPVFVKDCVTQARMAQALMLTHQVTGDPRALEVAEGILNYAQLNCLTGQGLYALSAGEDSQASKWTWTRDEIIEVLGEEDARWWIKASGMEELGNVPIELDPSRRLLRKNALALESGPVETASALGMTTDDFKRRFEGARQKLVQIRATRLRNLHSDSCAHLESSLNMVLAYVCAYQVTGREDWRDMAVKLMERCREEFVKQGVLLPYGTAGEPCLMGARARHHALEALASVRLQQIAPSQENIGRASAALAALVEDHLQEGVLWEAPEAGRIIDLPLQNDHMRLGVSTVGLLSQAYAHADQAGMSLSAELRVIAESVPVVALVDPLSCCDRLTGALERQFPTPPARLETR